MTGRHPLDLPYEDNPERAHVDLSAFVASGLVVLACVVDTALGPWPALTFRFVDGHGQQHPDVVLLLNDEQERAVPQLVEQATASALRAARGERR